MAILPVTAELIAAFVFDRGVAGRCLQLARQEVRLSRGELRRMLLRLGARRDSRRQAVAAALARLGDDSAADTATVSDREFFGVLGFAGAPSVDASAFEQADCIHDMNAPGLVDKLRSPVDMAVETGTAEHVFNIPQYLRNVCETLKVGGSVLHFVPAHSYLDHGFYQFSPTLFFDFYRANRFDLLDLILIETASEDWSHGRITRYVPGTFDRRDRRRFAERYVILGIAARKRADSTSDAIPQQRIYAASAGWAADDAVDLLAQATEPVALDGPYLHDVGACWRAPALAPGIPSIDPVAHDYWSARTGGRSVPRTPVMKTFERWDEAASHIGATRSYLPRRTAAIRTATGGPTRSASYDQKTSVRHLTPPCRTSR